MRVLCVTNMYPAPERPNYGTFVKSQVDSLAAQGVEIDVLYIEGHKRKSTYIYAPLQVLKRALSGRYDLIHAHYGLSGVMARFQWSLPLVVSYCGSDLYGHTDGDGKGGGAESALVKLHKSLARHADAVIVKSAAMAELLPECDAEVIPNGVDFSLFQPLDRAACRKELGLGADKRYVLFPYAADRPRKNYKAIAEAVALFNDRRAPADAPAEVLIVSNEPNERLPLYMNGADALALASPWEGSPNAVKEALACNLPIVSTDVGDVRELTANVDGCFLTSPRPEAIAESLERAFATSRSDGRVRSEALRIERIAARVIKVYEKALSKRRSAKRRTRSASRGA